VIVEDYDRSVFINCPFDSRYLPLLHAVTFAVLDCGFFARSALEVEDGGEVRIRKLMRIIRESRYGIHDISRVQLDSRNRLPRFNMPLELGLFLGAQEFGAREQRTKRSLILDRDRYRYQRFCSTSRGRTSARTATIPRWRPRRCARCWPRPWAGRRASPARQGSWRGTPSSARSFPRSAARCSSGSRNCSSWSSAR